MSETPTPNLEAIDAPRSRMGSRTRMALTLFDQGIVSIATYGTGVLVARATAEGVGLYALVFTLWVLGSEVHNSLVSTPQMLKLPRLSDTQGKQFNGSLLIHQLGLSLVLTVLLLLASAVLFGLSGQFPGRHHFADYSLVTLMAALTLAPLAFRNFARNHCLTIRDVPSALTLDIVVSLLQLGGVALLYFHGDLHQWWLAVLIVGAANLASALLWLSMARSHFTFDASRVVSDFTQNWQTTRYFFASMLIWFAGMYLYPWLISSIAGSAAAGVWFACFALANLGNPLLMGVQNYMGPAIAHAHVERDAAAFRRYVMTSTVAFCLLVLPVCIVMATLAEFLLTTLNGPAYTGYGVVTATLVFTMLLQGVSFPTSRGLFSLNRAGVDTLANVGPVLVLATLGVFLIRRHGVQGAAVTLIVAQTIGSLTRLIAFWFVSRPEATLAVPPNVEAA
jgi:O-antigen/teichoic acid export membrane protein